MKGVRGAKKSPEGGLGNAEKGVRGAPVNLRRATGQLISKDYRVNITKF